MILLFSAVAFSSSVSNILLFLSDDIDVIEAVVRSSSSTCNFFGIGVFLCRISTGSMISSTHSLNANFVSENVLE